MRALLAATALTVLASSPVLSQAKPDFSGSWKLNAELSDPGPQGGGGGGRGMGPASEVTIAQTDETLVLTQKAGDQSRTLTYYLDGRESKNPGMRGSEMVSQARWDGASLVIEGASTFNGPNGQMTIKVREVRTLSADGKQLSTVVSTTSPRGENVRKLVYEKQ